MDARTERYAAALSEMIRRETVSASGARDGTKFTEFRALLTELFPHIFGVCQRTDFPDGFVLRWQGRDHAQPPVLFMNHHDVVEAAEGWSHAPFSV